MRAFNQSLLMAKDDVWSTESEFCCQARLEAGCEISLSELTADGKRMGAVTR